MAESRSMLVPETDRERLYLTWYDLSVLYDDARSRAARAADVQATKALTDEAWSAYVESISDVPSAGPRS
ncbi:MAG: hypothetical protein IIC95_07020 [Chloroflexi bacterium]|nr:hypothetical protein [Chloroflexota bacterium]